MQHSASPMSTIRRALITKGDRPSWLNNGLAASWRRCADHGLRYDGSAPLELLSTHSFKNELTRNRALVAAADHAMNEVANTLNGLEFGIMLTDKTGVVLDSRMHRTPYLRKVMRPGLDLSEKTVGTSAMSVVISTQSGAEVIGDAHYFNNLSHLKCVASPVFGTDGTLAGILNITATSQMPQEIVRQVLNETARDIEITLVKSLSDNFVRFGYGANSSSIDGVLAFGPDGEVLGANSCALNMLGLSEITPQSAQFSDLFNAQFGDVISGGHVGRKLSILNTDARQQVTLREVSRARDIKAVIVQNDTPKPVTFGDTTLEQDLTNSIDAMNAYLPVLLCGASGTGKSLAAQWLHKQSSGSHLESVEINCGAISPDSLQEVFEHLYSGTPIGCYYIRDLDLLCQRDQSRLARFIESKPDVAIICSSRASLQMADQSVLREDLYYLLRPSMVTLPALCNRGQAQQLIKKLLKRGLSRRRISVNVYNAMYSYSWPGNIRELIACIDQIAASCVLGKTVTLKHIRPLISAPIALPTLETDTRLDQMQSFAIDQALAFCNGNRSAAAKRLGISRATLHRKLKARLS
ncbi:MAG: hypothetical protein COB84_06655 [Rhodobacteraceae bacterium]|nr:MAG: hypothetical protein COB84_06655 [Paracoccaceae bacterium]